mmetsp:Transcript_117363/g.374010  ORF Transcript_117363/g.374010 Transcript_117363/m.374010 type:complete len:142 (+) Transcript_117363:536-961(+)
MRGFVEFASLSAARKAIQRCEGSPWAHVGWARPEACVSLLWAAPPPTSPAGCAGVGVGADGLLAGASSPGAEEAEAWPVVRFLPEGCGSAADADVLHLLPTWLWRAVNAAWPGENDDEDDVPTESQQRAHRRVVLLSEALS